MKRSTERILATFVGSLALGPLMLHLDGRRRGVDEAVVNRQFGYEELRGLRVGSRGAERLDGRPALVTQLGRERGHDAASFAGAVRIGGAGSDRFPPTDWLD